MLFERWKRAVVHLEGAGQSTSIAEHTERWRTFWDSVDNGQSFAEASEATLQFNRDIRSTGTAVYVEHYSRRYLLTARHVLHDFIEAEGRTVLDAVETRSADNAIYQAIFRVPKWDELIQPKSKRRVPEMLTTLGAGVEWLQAYTFSEPAIDLVVISLSNRSALGFSDELDQLGYEPILSTDILAGPSAEGAEIFSVGYPDAISSMGIMDDSSPLWQWRASVASSLPTFAFGRIALLHTQLPFFWADISLYPGNSGGPLVENEKLVGIVSGQASMQAEFEEALAPVHLRLPFAKCIPGCLALQLLDAQKVKDQAVEALRDDALDKKQSKWRS